MQGIHPCLWFNGEAEEAARFYTSLFSNGRVKQSVRNTVSTAAASGLSPDTALFVEFEIEGLSLLGLNGGPGASLTPSSSFFVACESEAEIERLWQALSAGGEVRMALDSYPWSDRYGWTKDRFGVEWQLLLGAQKQKIVPGLLFVDALFGRGEEAVAFYLTTFPNSKIDFLARDETTESFSHCRFTLSGQEFVVMEGAGQHGHAFTPAFSLMVQCDTQEEIDTFWARLTSDGGKPGECGWLTDKFGMSWQIVPASLGRLLANPQSAEKVIGEVRKMTKLDLAAMERAAKT